MNFGLVNRVSMITGNVGGQALGRDKGGGPRVVVSTAAFYARVRGSVLGPGGLKEAKNVSSPSTCESQYCGEPLWPRGSVSASDRHGSNFESCVWRTESSHHPQEVLLAQFSLYVHKGGLKPDSFHFIWSWQTVKAKHNKDDLYQAFTIGRQ